MYLLDSYEEGSYLYCKIDCSLSICVCFGSQWRIKSLQRKMTCITRT